MKFEPQNKLKDLSSGSKTAIAVVAGAVLVCAVSYGAYSYFSLSQERISLLQEVESLQNDKTALMQTSKEQKAIIDGFNGQIQSLGTTVGALEKLSKLDPELLMKYSKVYFLSENYRPSDLANIDPKYLYGKDFAYFHAKALPYLTDLIEAAKADGVDLLVASAFRSFGEQAAIKSGYTVVYGAGTANSFSADQGYSEHQLGTTVDFTTKDIGGNFSKFKSDPAYKWLQSNAYKYGFILSYPDNNDYYIFEPWHWRFVGKELAKRLYIDKENFYDLGQREIDQYLISIFD